MACNIAQMEPEEQVSGRAAKRARKAAREEQEAEARRQRLAEIERVKAEAKQEVQAELELVKAANAVAPAGSTSWRCAFHSNLCASVIA